MGKREKHGTEAIIPIKYARFTPNRSVIREKKKTLKAPFRIPKTDRIVPITGGSSSRPPSAMGVERNTGCRTRKVISTRARNE